VLEFPGSARVDCSGLSFNCCFAMEAFDLQSVELDVKLLLDEVLKDIVALIK